MESLRIVNDIENTVANALKLYRVGQRIVEDAELVVVRRTKQLETQASLCNQARDAQEHVNAFLAGTASLDMTKITTLDTACTLSSFAVAAVREYEPGDSG